MTGFRRDAQDSAVLGSMRLSQAVREAAVELPAYVYDVDGMTETLRSLRHGFGDAPHLVAYAIKANSAGTVVRAFAAEGAGVDAVSGAEVELALSCGVPEKQVVMSGVAKSDAEIDLALFKGILAIQAESVEELQRISARALAAGHRADVSLRVNPGIEIDSHAHIATGHDAAKFGISESDLGAAYAVIDGSEGRLSQVGVSVHLGSMMTSTEAYARSARKLCDLARERRGAAPKLKYVDFGGGFGIDYGNAPSVPPSEFAHTCVRTLRDAGLSDLMIVVEPGRSLVAPYGVLVARIVQTKRSAERRWTMINAGMNDLIRPALYSAKHRIELCDASPQEPEWRVVGPVCESSDDFGAHALGPDPQGLVAIRDAGAYGFVMASEYNGRALPSEVFLKGGKIVSVSRSPGRNAWLQRRLEA
ncbi:MAG TPA: diaminopimelate decarboxylase [Polyangiaceae bacterium]|nr:diaminopimelate decarboxylase [Polyangiaceae bacterium]